MKTRARDTGGRRGERPVAGEEGFMLDPERNAAWADVYQQSFAIQYEYPVYFTRDLFDPTNPCLRRALCRLESDKRHRVALFVDEGVTLAWPDLLPRIARHACRHPGMMEIAGALAELN